MSGGERAKKRTNPGWRDYCATIGDRSTLFGTISDRWAPQRALYVGSYLDLSPSMSIPAVTYVDVDRRAARFFEDRARVTHELAGRTRPGAAREIHFLEHDYTRPLPVDDGGMDLVISLFAGPTWDYVARYLAPDGLFLANASHGDASLAALDPQMRLVAVVEQDEDGYTLTTDELDLYLAPRAPATADPATIRRTGRGVRYTREAFAYLFGRGTSTPYP